MKKKCGFLCKLLWLLVVIGAINWGLVGAFDFNLVSVIFDSGEMMSTGSKIIYILVGVSGLWMLLQAFGIGSCKSCKSCSTCESGSESMDQSHHEAQSHHS